MTTLALILGYSVMGAGGVALVVVAWWQALDYAYRHVVHTQEFFDVLVRYKREQRASAELAEQRKADSFMGRPE